MNGAAARWAPHGRDDTEGWVLAYDEPFSTLGSDLALRRHRRWVEGINAYYRTRFRSEIRVVDGLLYFRPSWRFAGRPARLWMALWKLVRWLTSQRIHRDYTERIVPEHRRRIEAVDRQTLRKVDTATLARRFDDSVWWYLDLQRLSLAANGIATTSAALLDWLCRRWLGDGVPMRAPDFLTGLDNVTVERDQELHRLGSLLREALTPAELARMGFKDLLEFEGLDGCGSRFSAEIQTFLDGYGYVWADRYPRDPAWEIDEKAAVASLVHLVQLPAGAGIPRIHDEQQRRRAQAVETAARRLAADAPFSLQLRVFRWVLRRAERYFPRHEDRNHRVYQAVMAMREHAREIGRRLAGDGLVESPSDVFFLTWDEIRASLAGRSPASVPRDRAVERRLGYESGRQRRGGTEGGPHLSTEPGGTEFVGEPCSPGVASGRARLVSGMGQLNRVVAGDIVVCREMRPAWTSVLGRAGGVVAEVGGLLSHGATLAREYGIPAVFNVPGVTERLPDGSDVVVDGDRGVVSMRDALGDPTP